MLVGCLPQNSSHRINFKKTKKARFWNHCQSVHLCTGSINGVQMVIYILNVVHAREYGAYCIYNQQVCVQQFCCYEKLYQ